MFRLVLHLVEQSQRGIVLADVVERLGAVDRRVGPEAGLRRAATCLRLRRQRSAAASALS